MSDPEAKQYEAAQFLYLKISSYYFSSQNSDITSLKKIGSQNWEHLCWFAHGHRISADLYKKLSRCGLLSSLPEEERDFLEGSSYLASDDIKNARAEITMLQTIFQDNVDVIWLKGAAMAIAGCIGDPSTRTMADIDFLVDDANLDRAAEMLEAEGYQFDIIMPRPISDYYQSKHLPQLISQSNQFALEVHRELFDSAYLTVEGLSAQSLYNRAINHVTDGMGFKVPSPEDMFLHAFFESQYVDNHELAGIDCYKSMLDCVYLVLEAEEFDWAHVKQVVADASATASLYLFVKRIEICVFPDARLWDIDRSSMSWRRRYNDWARRSPKSAASIAVATLHVKHLPRLIHLHKEHKIINRANRANPEYAAKGLDLLNVNWWLKRKNHIVQMFYRT